MMSERSEKRLDVIGEILFGYLKEHSYSSLIRDYLRDRPLSLVYQIYEALKEGNTTESIKNYLMKKYPYPGDYKKDPIFSALLSSSIKEAEEEFKNPGYLNEVNKSESKDSFTHFRSRKKERIRTWEPKLLYGINDDAR